MALLEGKVAIINGSTNGMGRGSAKLFAKEGAKVVVVGRGNSEDSIQRGKQVVSDIEEAGGTAIYVSCDSTKEEDVKNMIDVTIKEFGKIDILYNVVGDGRSKPLQDETVDEWHYTFDTNLLSCFLAIKYAMPYLLESKGNIINTSSVAGLRPIVHNNYAYGACNAGVAQMTKILARDYGPKGIRVNAIAPGPILTNAWAVAPPDLLEQQASLVPLKRMGQPEDIAKVALFLASDMASYVTGTVITVDGGQALS